jgi:predicted kinase
MTEAARRSLLRLASAAGCPSAAIVFDLSLERCLEQNAVRLERQVPEAVVRRQHRQLRSAIERLPGEGYAAIHRLHDSDIAEG